MPSAARKPCSQPGCSELVDHGRCTTHAAQYEQRRGSSTARGYGTEHRRLRAKLAPKAVGKRCVRCGQPIRPGQPIDLDHTDDRTGYRGMAHAKCNRTAGAIKANSRH